MKKSQYNLPLGKKITPSIRFVYRDFGAFFIENQMVVIFMMI